MNEPPTLFSGHPRLEEHACIFITLTPIPKPRPRPRFPAPCRPGSPGTLGACRAVVRGHPCPRVLLFRSSTWNPRWPGVLVVVVKLHGWLGDDA